MKPTVVLLHGLGRTHRSMGGLRRHLEREGFPTWACSYPSRRAPIAVMAADVAARIQAEVKADALVGVTHSMGGILVRHMRDVLPWRGLVMLAPPNQGSRVALSLRHRSVFRRLLGPAGEDLCEAASWPAPPAPFAVIAGARPGVLNPTSWIAQRRVFAAGEPNDGTLAVEETRLPGMAAFATVAASHTWIMNHPEARALVLKFLTDGSF